MYMVDTTVKAIGAHNGTTRAVDNNYILHWPHIHHHAEKCTLGHCKVELLSTGPIPLCLLVYHNWMSHVKLLR